MDEHHAMALAYKKDPETEQLKYDAQIKHKVKLLVANDNYKNKERKDEPMTEEALMPIYHFEDLGRLGEKLN
jgi:hypothetical protein